MCEYAQTSHESRSWSGHENPFRGIVRSYEGVNEEAKTLSFPTSITRVAKNTIKGKAKFMPAHRTLSIIFFWPEKHKESPNAISSCFIVYFLGVNWNVKQKWKLNLRSIRNILHISNSKMFKQEISISSVLLFLKWSLLKCDT